MSEKLISLIRNGDGLPVSNCDFSTSVPAGEIVYLQSDTNQASCEVKGKIELDENGCCLQFRCGHCFPVSVKLVQRRAGVIGV